MAEALLKGPATMRNGLWRKPARVLAPLLATAGLLVIAAPALAVSGAGYTTTNAAVDAGPLCQNGNPGVNCNIYFSKMFVWTNGGPKTNKLLPDGKYFFAVLVPGNQPDPNDRAP